ncbi:peptide chain release factor 1 [Desulforegula conservatrix]|uniref:peptide chain release factor 1 n=1 Tax=Desulforegula conservatrix TaxID=153026 RepID=UPI000421306D|nr:peptide chain release factor 1 [Desulforegula conservatrix]
MFDKLLGVEERFIKLEQLLSDPDVVRDQSKYQKYLKEHAGIAELVETFRTYRKTLEDIEDSKLLLEEGDSDLKDLALDELKSLDDRKEELEANLKKLLIPKDPNDDRSVIVEIRAGTGGDEAAIFAGDLLRMYSRYAERRNWKVEMMDSSLSEAGGFKEVIIMIKGVGAYSAFKFESGTHRVQRVPATESQGRIHTSAATVAVLPEAEDVEVHVDPGDLRVDVYRSSGAGGQHVNTTDSAVRITHLPTGTVVTCQDERSQIKNRAKAMSILKARILDKMNRDANASRSQARKDQVGSGDRSERIRTYNYPQGRVTDHRIGLTLYKLEMVMEGDVDEIIESLAAYYQAQALQENETAF